MTIKVIRLATLLLALAWLSTPTLCQTVSPPAFFAPSALAEPAPGPVAPAARPWTAEEESDARVLLAERFCEIALTLAHNPHLSKPLLRQSATLMEAATQLNPTEPRFVRLLAMAREQSGDIDGAIKAWIKYRRPGMAPDDEVGQIALIDLYLSTMQSADSKLTYLKALLEKQSINNVVKALIAVRAVVLLNERSPEEAQAMLARARAYYPIPKVALLEWQMLPASATTAQRFAALLNVIRANPTDPDALGLVADMLANAGLSEQSLTWYGMLIDVHRARGTVPNDSSVINYLAERYRAGESTVASDELDRILQKNPDVSAAWDLRLTIARDNESEQLLRQRRHVLHREIADVSRQILHLPALAPEPASSRPGNSAAPSLTSPDLAGPSLAPGVPTTVPATAPTTAPAEIQLDEPPLPPLTETILAVKQSNDAQLRPLFINLLGDLAWFEIYFAHKADLASAPIDALKQLVPAENVTLQRLIGWQDVVSGNIAGAKAIFTAQQDADPLSALGLFRLEEQQNHTNEAAAIGSKILSQPHSGILGAIILQATKGRGLKPANPSSDAAVIKALLDKFPRDWLEINRTPFRFYSIHADPLKVGHRLGEPLLAEVEIHNESKLDITIGEFGLLDPTLIFDAQIRGASPKIFNAIVVDRMMGKYVLGPNDSIRQTVRIDQGDLSAALALKPASMMFINADVVTNPLPSNSVIRPKAGGYVKTFSKMFLRTPGPLAIDHDRRKLFDNLANGTPVDKILDIDLLAAYFRQAALPTATPDEVTFADQYANTIEKTKSDSAPGVKLWASYTLALLKTGAREEKEIDDMLRSTSVESRLLGLVAAGFLPVDTAKQFAAKVLNDSDPLVKSYAATMIEAMQPPTTHPAVIQPTK